MPKLRDSPSAGEKVAELDLPNSVCIPWQEQIQLNISVRRRLQWSSMFQARFPTADLKASKLI